MLILKLIPKEKQQQEKKKKKKKKIDINEIIINVMT